MFSVAQTDNPFKTDCLATGDDRAVRERTAVARTPEMNPDPFVTVVFVVTDPKARRAGHRIGVKIWRAGQTL
jgi:hypothetical protein